MLSVLLVIAEVELMFQPFLKILPRFPLFFCVFFAETPGIEPGPHDRQSRILAVGTMPPNVGGPCENRTRVS